MFLCYQRSFSQLNALTEKTINLDKRIQQMNNLGSIFSSITTELDALSELLSNAGLIIHYKALLNETDVKKLRDKGGQLYDMYYNTLETICQLTINEPNKICWHWLWLLVINKLTLPEIRITASHSLFRDDDTSATQALLNDLTYQLTHMISRVLFEEEHIPCQTAMENLSDIVAFYLCANKQAADSITDIRQNDILLNIRRYILSCPRFKEIQPATPFEFEIMINDTIITMTSFNVSFNFEGYFTL